MDKGRMEGGERSNGKTKKARDNRYPAGTLTLVKMYVGHAVYKGDERLFYDRGANGVWPVPLLNALGWKVVFVSMDDEHFSRDQMNWQTLPSLQEMRRAWNSFQREKKEGQLLRASEEVARLTEELGKAVRT